MEDFTVAEGWIHNRRVKILEEWGCNTYIISSEIFSRIRHNLKLYWFDATVEHSNKSSIESPEYIVLEETLTFEGYL